MRIYKGIVYVAQDRTNNGLPPFAAVIYHVVFNFYIWRFSRTRGASVSLNHCNANRLKKIKYIPRGDNYFFFFSDIVNYFTGQWQVSYIFCFLYLSIPIILLIMIRKFDFANLIIISIKCKSYIIWLSSSYISAFN